MAIIKKFTIMNICDTLLFKQKLGPLKTKNVLEGKYKYKSK